MNLLIAILIATQSAEIRFPEREPTPSPEPDAAGVIGEVRSDEWYVIESDAELIAITSPSGIARVVTDTGPLKIKGKFADSAGRTETRTYSAKHIYMVESAAEGKCELILIPVGVTGEAELVRQMLAVVGPRPPPDPNVDPKPEPPGPAGKLMVLIVEETDARGTLPAGQIPIFGAKEIREFAKTAGELRILDKDQDISGAEAWIQTAFKEPRQSLPWIVLSNGRTGYSGPLPASVADTMTLLRRFHSADNR